MPGDFNFMYAEGDMLLSIVITDIHPDHTFTIDSDPDGTPERTLATGDRVLAADIQHLVATETMFTTIGGNIFACRATDGMDDSLADSAFNLMTL